MFLVRECADVASCEAFGQRGQQVHSTAPTRVAASALDFTQLCQPAEIAPSSPQWLHEIKLDGFRVSAPLNPAVCGNRAERAPNPNSMDLYSQGLAWLNKGPTPDNLAQARSFFDRALTADPDNVEALVGSGAADMAEGVFSYAPDPLAAFAAAEAKLTKVLSSVPDHARAHKDLGLVDMMTKRAAEGIAECEHALALDRNLADAHALIAPPRQLRASGRVVSTGARGQPKLSASIFLLGRRSRATRSTRRGAFRSQGRSRAQPGLRRLPLSRQLDGGERRSDVSGPA